MAKLRNIKFSVSGDCPKTVSLHGKPVLELRLDTVTAWADLHLPIERDLINAAAKLIGANFRLTNDWRLEFDGCLYEKFVSGVPSPRRKLVVTRHAEKRYRSRVSGKVANPAAKISNLLINGVKISASQVYSKGVVAAMDGDTVVTVYRPDRADTQAKVKNGLTSRRQSLYCAS